jgi:hypothetical protein
MPQTQITAAFGKKRALTLEQPDSDKENEAPGASDPSAPLKRRKSVGSDRTVALRDRFRSDPELCKRLLARLPSTRVGWCDIVSLKPTKSDGYIQVSWEGCNKFAMLQQVVLWAAGYDVLEGEDCSHRCHNTACKTVGHVVSDPTSVNQGRKGCEVQHPCLPGHGDCYQWTCPHGTADSFVCCIKYAEGFNSHEDFVARSVLHPRFW